MTRPYRSALVLSQSQLARALTTTDRVWHPDRPDVLVDCGALFELSCHYLYDDPRSLPAGYSRRRVRCGAISRGATVKCQARRVTTSRSLSRPARAGWSYGLDRGLLQDAPPRRAAKCFQSLFMSALYSMFPMHNLVRLYGYSPALQHSSASIHHS